MSKQKLQRKIDELLGNVPEEVIEIHYINPINGEVTIWFSSPPATGAKTKPDKPIITSKS